MTQFTSELSCLLDPCKNVSLTLHFLSYQEIQSTVPGKYCFFSSLQVLGVTPATASLRPLLHELISLLALSLLVN